MTNDEFRTMALKIPAAVERSHMNHPDFRVAGKIFASLGVPDKNWGMVKLTPQQQRTFIEKAPEVFKPCSGAWGRQGYTNVYLPFAKTNIVRAALGGRRQRTSHQRRRKSLTSNIQRPTLNESGQRRFTAATGRSEKMRSRTSVEMRRRLFHRCKIAE